MVMLAEPDADSIQSNRGNDDVLDVRREAPPKRGDPSFILDSGASHHATSDKWLLSDLDLIFVAFALVITSFAYQRPLTPPVTAGSVVSDKFQLAGVLYAPDLAPGTVHVSVRQLAALGYHVVFGVGRCFVRTGSGGKVVGEGRLGDDGLYRLDFLKMPLHQAAAPVADGADTTV